MNKQLVLGHVQRTVGIVLAISYLLAVFAVIRTQLVPNKFLVIIIPATALVVAFLVFKHLKKTLSTPKSVILDIVSLLIVTLSLYVFSIGNATTGFLDKIQETGYSTEEYSIIAKKDRNIDLAKNNQHTALLATDTNSDLVKTEVNKKTKTEYKDYAELTSLTMALNTQEADTSALKSSYVQLLEDNNNSFYQTIEVLATFTIKVKTDAVETKTDTTKPFVV